VCLSPLNKTPVVPGKLQGYMAAGLPVVTFLNRESDGHQIVKHAEAGLSAPSDDQKACTSALRDLLKQKDLTSLGLRGQAYARQHFSKASCVNQLESLLVSSGP
jgi:colanic acid biosynthesis glycosyl transferase WcaI